MLSSEELKFMISGIDTEIEKVNNEIEKLREERLKSLIEKKEGYSNQLKLLNSSNEIKILDEKIKKVENNSKLSSDEKKLRIIKPRHKKSLLEEAIKRLNEINQRK